ncbi:hypothetical protein M2409_000453 [Sphingobacterium sp. JUb21]|nr:hypothetical protein [Sphingobacterium sp. JUb21]
MKFFYEIRYKFNIPTESLYFFTLLIKACKTDEAVIAKL